MYKLIIEDDEGKTTVVPLIRDEISIGRKEGNTIRLTERNVSRHHARLYRQSGTVYVEDLNSHNGTKINGERLQKRTAIGEGDSIQIGDYRLSVKLDRTDSKGPPQTDEPLTRPFVKPSEAPPPAAASPPTSAATVSLPQSASTIPVTSLPAPSPEKPARLVVISSNFAGQEFPLDKAAVVIGRTDENDVIINHRSISRHHAKIVKEGNHYHIVDLQSANGVRVNGEEYGKVELRKGDQIDLGHVRLVFVQSGQEFDIKGKIVDIEGTGRGRSWVTWVVVMLVLVGGLGVGARYILPQLGGVGRSDPDAEAGKLLVDVDTDLHAKRWGDAIEKVERVLQIASTSQQTRESANMKRDRAQTEKKAQAVYERFVSAAGKQSYDEALHIYKELPADSVYHALAQDAYTTIFPLFIEQHLHLAEEARQRGACQERDAQVQLVFDVAQGHIQAQAVKDKACPERVAMETPPPPHGKKPQPRPSVQPDTAKPDNSGSSPAAEPPTKGGMSEEEAVDHLNQAQAAYINGEFSKAIELARPASKTMPSRAWRIIGAAACNTRDLKMVADAFKHIDDQSRQFVVYVCQRQGVERVGTSLQFRLIE